MEIKKLTEELELTSWEHEAESSIYLEVVGERACEWRQLIDSLAGDFNRKEVRRMWNSLVGLMPSLNSSSGHRIKHLISVGIVGVLC